MIPKQPTAFPTQQAAVAFLAILIAGFLQHAVSNRERFPVADEVGYLQVAYGVYEHGVFGAAVKIDETPQPQMFFGPLYPAFVAGLMAVDDELASSIECILRHHPTGSAAKTCQPYYGLFVPVQLGLAAISIVLVWVSAQVLWRSLVCAWLAGALALAAGEHTYYANHFLTENLVLPLFGALCLVFVLAWRRRSLGWLAGAGALIGLLALVRPVFAYLLYAGCSALLVAVVVQRGAARRRLLAASLVFALAYGAIAGGWMLRNHVSFGNFALSDGYASFILAQRVAYNRMTAGEWGVAFIYWLPDFGDSLAEALFPESLYSRLGFSDPDSFYQRGNKQTRTETLDAAGSYEAHLRYLLTEEVLAHPFKHVAVTLPLAWRGMFVAKYWSLVTLLFFVPLMVYSVRRKWSEFVLFSAPPWFMLGLHAFVSVNVPRYNLILIPCLAIATAWVLTRAGQRWRVRRTMDGARGMSNREEHGK